MKRAIALLMLCVLLLGIGMGAQASEQEKIDRLVRVVDAALKEGGYAYTYDPEYECFDLEFSLDSTLQSAETIIFIYDDMVSVVVYASLAAKEARLDEMAKFLTLVNNEIYYAQFRMDYESGSISCRSAQIVEEVLPGALEIYTLLEMPVGYLDRFGDGIARVALGTSAFEAFQAYADE